MRRRDAFSLYWASLPGCTQRQSGCSHACTVGYRLSLSTDVEAAFAGIQRIEAFCRYVSIRRETNSQGSSAADDWLGPIVTTSSGAHQVSGLPEVFLPARSTAELCCRTSPGMGR